MIYQGKAKYPLTDVMLHTAATPANWYVGKSADEMMAEIRQWHKARGWRREGYHRLFAPDGTMALGRSIYEIGAGCAGYNRGVVHLVFVPTVWVDKIGAFEDFYTVEQSQAAKAYIAELKELHGGALNVVGHNDFANKLCPGFKVKSSDWLPADIGMAA